MKYFSDYSDSELYDRFGVFRVKGERPCVYCGRPTRFIDSDTGAELCSPECQNDLFGDYLRYVAERREKMKEEKHDESSF